MFLVREALGRDPGQFGDFVRARHRVRMPVVLSRAGTKGEGRRMKVEGSRLKGDGRISDGKRRGFVLGLAAT